MALRGVADDFRTDERLAFTPSAHHDTIPKTDKRDSPQPQRTTYRPCEPSDILNPTGTATLDEAAHAVAAHLKAIAGNTEFQNMLERGVPITELEKLLKRLRPTNKVFIVKQDEGFWPDARGIIWDMRAKANGYYQPLDVVACPVTDLDTAGLLEYIGGCKDQDMVDQVCSSGVRFDADAPLDMVISVHLLSLGLGFSNVDATIRDLTTRGWVAICDSWPFLPMRAIAQGTRPKKNTTKLRRISDASSPHPEQAPAGTDVKSLNALINAKAVLPGPYRFGNDTVNTTGVLAASDLPAPTPSKRPNTKLPPEMKVKIPDMMHDMARLRYAAHVYDEDLYLWTTDWTTMFNQFALASSELWLACLLWLDPSGELCYVVDKKLGFGFANASNIAQRFSDAVAQGLLAKFDEGERSRFEDETDPARLRYIGQRKQTSKVTGRDEVNTRALWFYTDDPLLLIVGVEPFLRFVRIWEEFCARTQMLESVDKRQAGVVAEWIGFDTYTTLGTVVITPPKRLRALKELRRVAAAEIDAADMRKLMGLLEHVGPWASQLRDAYAPMYRALRSAPYNVRAIPIDDDARQCALQWHDVLASAPGLPCGAVFSDEHKPTPCTERYFVFQDAAKLGARKPGLGGYCHGFAWRVTLTSDMVTGKYEMPITVLEYVAIGISLIVFDSILPDGDLPEMAKHDNTALRELIALGSDSLTSIDAALELRSKSEGMIYVTTRLRALPQLVSRRRRLRLAHVYGEGNVIADAESRHMQDVIDALVHQLRIDYRRMAVPAEAHKFLADVFERHKRVVDGRGSGMHKRTGARAAPHNTAKRTRTALEHEKHRSVTMRSNVAGDGPAHELGTPGGRVGLSLSNNATPSTPHDARDVPRTPTRQPTPRRAHLRPSPSQGVPGGIRMPSLGTPDRHDNNPPPSHARNFEDVTQSSTPRRSTLNTRNVVPLRSPPRRDATAHAQPHTAALDGADREQARLVNMLCDDESALRIGAERDVISAWSSQVSEYVSRASAESTIAGDSGQWRDWVAICRALRTEEWRRRGADDGDTERYIRRETWLICVAMLMKYRMMRPRRRSSAAPNPNSALNMVLAVRRVHGRAQITLPPCKALQAVLKGMLRQHVEEHGADSLRPEQADPLTVEDRAAIYAVPDGTRLKSGDVVRWTSLLFVSFRALLDTLCDTGGRKADQLCARPQLTNYDTNRAHIKWRIRGLLMAAPTTEQLQSIRVGDSAIMLPSPMKNDQFGQVFGNKPMHLPVLDGMCAARSLAAMEIHLPIAGEQRKRVSAYCVDRNFTPLVRSKADSIMSGLVQVALPSKVGRLTLKSPRVWKATALRAAGADVPTLQCEVRWRTPESAEVYARVDANVSATWIRRIYDVQTDALITSNMPTYDDDGLYRAVQHNVERLADKDADGGDFTDDESDVGEPEDGSTADMPLTAAATEQLAADTAAAPNTGTRTPTTPPRRRARTAGEVVRDPTDGVQAATAPPTAPPAATAARRRTRRPAPEHSTPISFQQTNPKRVASQSAARYENYKVARTYGEFLTRGGRPADFAFDAAHDFVRLE